MELCCGALLGMGESVDQRLELLGDSAGARPDRGAAQLLEPASRHPAWPTLRRPAPLEALRWIALFRLALPDVMLRYAGGREITLRELQAMGMTSGHQRPDRRQLPHDASGARPTEDLQMLADLKMPIGTLSKVF